MKKKHKYTIKEFEEIIESLFCNEPKLKQMLQKSTEIFDKLINKLEEDEIDLLFEYENLENAISTYENYILINNLKKIKR